MILFVGDGMGHQTLPAARMNLGGESASLFWEKFPHTANSKTYGVDMQVPGKFLPPLKLLLQLLFEKKIPLESGGAANAMNTGIKTSFKAIGMNGNNQHSVCELQNHPENFVDSISAYFQRQNRSTGFVTTTRITHATPAATYVHIADRFWESDYDIKTTSSCNIDTVDDIAEQLIHGSTGSKMRVMFGGGSKYFINGSYSEHGVTGRRIDGKHLINDWLNVNSARKYIRNRDELLDLDANTKEVLGMFYPDSFPYHLDILSKNLQGSIPTLSEMTSKAIDILSKDPKGFYLMVEGGLIDAGHHASQAKYALDETIEFSKAIETALGKVNLDETLIVVTADHSHTFSVSGYAVSVASL